MHWKEYRITRTRVATGEADGARRVIELLDGRVLVEREGAASRIVDARFDRALALAARTPRTALAGWWTRFRRWLASWIGGER